MHTEALEGIQFASFYVVHKTCLHRTSNNGSNINSIFVSFYIRYALLPSYLQWQELQPFGLSQPSRHCIQQW